MKQYLLIAAIVVAATYGCEEQKQNEPHDGVVYCERVVVFGCEYLKTYVDGGYVLTHKGNCTNHTATVRGLERE